MIPGTRVPVRDSGRVLGKFFPDLRVLVTKKGALHERSGSGPGGRVVRPAGPASGVWVGCDPSESARSRRPRMIRRRRVPTRDSGCLSRNRAQRQLHRDGPRPAWGNHNPRFQVAITRTRRVFAASGAGRANAQGSSPLGVYRLTRELISAANALVAAVASQHREAQRLRSRLEERCALHLVKDQEPAAGMRVCRVSEP